MLLIEVAQHFIKPNFEDEYEEAMRYDELQQLSMEDWLQLCGTGKPVYFSKLTDVGNTTENNIEAAREHWKEVEPEKKQRFLAHKGAIEMPIVVVIDGKNDLLGGNTRLTGCIINGVDPMVWLIKV